MGKKYIVELGRCERLYKAFVSGNGKPGLTWLSPEIDLTPYTEPDLEYVRKEAYEQGFYIGYSKCLDKSYKDGLKDAWEAARKIHRMPEGDILDLFPDCYASVCTAAQAILKYDATEAIAKIKEYEDSKQKIKVGDEVKNTQTGVKFIVTRLWKNNHGEQGVGGFNWECSAFSTTLSLVVKTGRTFPEIATVLEKMRGEAE